MANEGSDFKQALLTGLRGKAKNIPSKYFYDAEGSRLFEKICALPEYYLTRIELGLLERHAKEIGRESLRDHVAEEGAEFAHDRVG
jgi:uncharacterized SAM-dependent methyltransferase